MPELGGLLASAGYESGDFLPLHTVRGTGQSASTASSTYEAEAGMVEVRIRPDIIAPADTQVQVAAGGQFDPSTDQLDYRIRNATDGETMVERTGITSVSNDSVGPTDYTFTTRTSTVIIRFQHRNSDNATSVTSRDVSLLIGISV